MRFSVLALSAVLMSAAAAQAASPIGTWNTPKRHGVVRVLDCGGGICGKIEGGDDITRDPNFADSKNSDASLRERKLKGAMIFEGLTGGPPEWTGKVYNPEDGRTYSGSITQVDENTLKLKGCALSIFCQTQVWTRAK